MGTDNKTFKYQIALSFAGEDRYLAEELAEMLSDGGVKVFYDKYKQAYLWGKDLYQHLQEVYRDSAEYCVIFISKYYLQKLWTKHELKQAQSRAFKENREYILPLRIDDTELPGINETIGYLDLREVTLQYVKDLLLEKMNFEKDSKTHSIEIKSKKGRLLGPGETYSLKDNETGFITTIRNLKLYPVYAPDDDHIKRMGEGHYKAGIVVKKKIFDQEKASKLFRFPYE